MPVCEWGQSYSPVKLPSYISHAQSCGGRVCVCFGWEMRTQTQRHGDKETVRDRGSLFTSRNWLNIIDCGEEINQSWSVALCPWQLNLTAFVLLRRHPPPLILHGWFLVPCLSALIPHQQRRRLPGDLLNPHDELSEEPSTLLLSEPPAAQTLFQPD